MALLHSKKNFSKFSITKGAVRVFSLYANELGKLTAYHYLLSMLKLNGCQEKGHQARPLILVRLNRGTAPWSLSYLACRNNWHEVSDKLKTFGPSFLPVGVTWVLYGLFYLRCIKEWGDSFHERGYGKQPWILNSDLYQTCQTHWAWKSYLKTDHHLSKSTLLRTQMEIIVWQRSWKYLTCTITGNMCSREFQCVYNLSPAKSLYISKFLAFPPSVTLTPAVPKGLRGLPRSVGGTCRFDTRAFSFGQ